MKALLIWTLAAIAAGGGVALAQSAAQKKTVPVSDRERFIGAWHLVSMGGPATEANSNRVRGTLIYTRDGHMSVQLMYPKAESSLSNNYVLNGYEASFGSYEIDEAKHTVTHRVQGSVTRDLVGKTLVRVYRFTDDGRLIVKSASPDETWAVVWEHY